MPPFCNLLLHLYVKTDNLPVLKGAIEFLPLLIYSLSNNSPSALFKLQSTTGVKRWETLTAESAVPHLKTSLVWSWFLLISGIITELGTCSYFSIRYIMNKMIILHFS